MLHTVTRKQGHRRHINQRMATGSKARGGPGAGYQHLRRQGGVVYAHVKAQTLVGSTPRSANALHKHAVRIVGHRIQFFLAAHFANIQGVAAEIGVSGDSLLDVRKRSPGSGKDVYQP